jgi:DNA mismatch repair protein MutS2
LAKLKSEVEIQNDLRAALEQERAAVAQKYARLEQEFGRREADRQRLFEAKMKAVVEDFSKQSLELLAQVRDRKAQLALQRTVDRHAARLKVDLRKKTQAPIISADQPPVRSTAVPETEWRVGDRVRLVDLGKAGTIEAIDGEQVVVQVGPLRFKTRRSGLEPEPEQPPSHESGPGPLTSGGILVELTPKANLRPELNLIGCRVDEALDRLDKFLDEAVLASLGTVRIIHGAGTGALRKAIRSALVGHPHVQRFQAEGGMTPETGGATVVELRKD